METIAERIQRAISESKFVYSKAGLKFFLKKLNSHYYGLDIKNIQYSALTKEKIYTGEWAWVIPLENLPENFDTNCAPVVETMGYLDMFSKSHEVAKFEKMMGYNVIDDATENITADVMDKLKPSLAIKPAHNFEKTYYAFLFYLNSGSDFESYAPLSNLLLDDYRKRKKIGEYADVIVKTTSISRRRFRGEVIEISRR